jgi:chromate reductase, NAD(P)H dehydrogenase (quinone)
MITIISCTNRQDSKTLQLAGIYKSYLSSKLVDVQLLSLLGKNVFERGNEMKAIEAQYLIPAEKFVFIMPEYNGSFPGVLKMLMDNSDIKKCWWHKKAMLVGLADGRAGNLRGLDHLTNILNYLKVNVHFNKLPFSRISEEIDANGNLLKESSGKIIEEQIAQFLQF